MKQYYIPYEANIDVNYIYVLLFYSIAEYNAKSKRFDVVKYTTQRDLTEKLNSKPNSLDMILENMSPDDIRKLLKKVL